MGRRLALARSAAGTPLDTANLYAKFKPAAKRAGVGWASFHSLRHTCATALFRSGKNAKQVQAWLGHHAASFTMDVYVHLLPDDVGEAPESFDVIVRSYMATEEGDTVIAQEMVR